MKRAEQDQLVDVASSDVARLTRRTTLSVLVLVVALPFVAWGAYGALRGLNDDAVGWTASNLPAKRDYLWFAQHFETPDSIIISWRGCTLDDPRLEQFCKALPACGPRDAQGGSLWFSRVISGSQTVQEMTEPPRSFAQREAVQRLTGVLVGPDGRTTCAIVVLSPVAASSGRHVLQAINDVARQCGIDPAELHLTGHVVETTALDTASLETLYNLAPPSALITILIAWPFLRSLRLAVIVLLGASFCQCCSLSMVYYTGREMNGMMGVLPMLVLVCFVSGAVQLNNYHLEVLPRVGPGRAALHGMFLGWVPCLLSVLTTAIGVGSLATSYVEPVYLFGVYGGLAIILVYAILFLVMPGGMAWTSAAEYRRIQAASSAGPETTRRWPWRWSWAPLARLVGSHGPWVLVACGAVLAIGCAGAPRLHGSLKLLDFFPLHSRIAQDHLWLEEHIGPLMPLEIVLGIDQSSPSNMIQRLQLVRRVENAIRGRQTAASTLSLCTFLPHPDLAASGRATIQRSVFNRRLEREVDTLADTTHYLAEVEGRQWWRITARLESLNDRSYEELVNEMRQAVAAALAEPSDAAWSDVSVIYTGMLPLLAESHPVLMRDLVVSFATSFAWNSLILTVGFWSLRLGLVSIFPIVFPIALVFGTLGWLKQSVDPGTMMTASVGLGIAIDNGVHYLTWFVRGLREGLSQQEAILRAYRCCGRAMLRSAAICVGGTLVYATSSFVPAARFGWLVAVLFVAGLVGDLLFLPALLSGRVGRLLVPRNAGRSPLPISAVD